MPAARRVLFALLVLASAALLANRAQAAATFAGSTCDDGTATSSPLHPGDAIVLRLALVNGGDADAQAVVAHLVFPACIDISAFDPLAMPFQVQVTPGPATVNWSAATRTLDASLGGAIAPGARVDVVITGLAAGAATGVCCQQPLVLHTDAPLGEATRDLEVGSGPTCTDITTCPVLSRSVQQLLAVRQMADVDLTWNGAAGAVTYDVWRVDDGDKRLVPFASRVGAAALPQVHAVCTALPPATRACSDAGAAGSGGNLYFYQSRGACGDGSEGVDDRPSCRGAATVTVSASRATIPKLAVPDGSCSAPGAILPVTLFASVADAGGTAIPNCPVAFLPVYDLVSGCGRGFGEFCGGNVSLTDASGVAAARYMVPQEDLDFCNCAPGGCPPAGGLCPTPERCVVGHTCDLTDDLFCQIGIRAAAGGVLSATAQLLEYGP